MKKKVYNIKPIHLGSLIDDTLKRHGIGRQVVASMIIKRADALMQDLLADHVKKDVRVISYKNEVITIACRHHPAMQEATRTAEDIKQSLFVDFPYIQLKEMVCKIFPSNFWE